jgi:hypothetical protein
VNVNHLLGTHDVLLMVIDTLRYDVAQEEWRAGRTPNLACLLSDDGWERRHTPGNFTYAAHQAFFAGFLPTPASPGKHPRLFATRFAGSETTHEQTAVFDTSDIIRGFASRGYRTVCIGGVGFFNPQAPLGRVLPAYFDEAHYSEAMGVTGRDSTEHQVRLAAKRLGEISERVFLFINVSALHQPNKHYVPEAFEDSRASHAAALRYVDRWMPVLFDALGARGSTLAIVCSDHGTCYGEDGFWGHRLAHPQVWTVPYAECVLTSGWARGRPAVDDLS